MSEDWANSVQLVEVLVLAAGAALSFGLLSWLLRPLFFIFYATRAALLSLVAGFVLLFATGQGREVIDSLMGSHSPHLLWFGLALFWWAIQCWHWSRVAIDLTFGNDRTRWQQRALTIIPRFYGLLVHLFAVVAIILSALRTRAEPAELAALIAAPAVSLALFLAVVLLRMRAFEELERRSPRAAALFATRPIHVGASLAEGGRALAPFSQLMLALSFLFFLCAMVLGGLRPVETGARFGSAAIAFGGLGSWVAALSILALLSRILHFPVIATLLAVRATLALVYGEHPLRTDPATDWGRDPTEPAGRSAFIDPRPPLASEVARWRESVAGEPAPVPVVLVAAAGGGLRAAWWTATALGALIERFSGLERRIVAISAVSGGALGATVLTAAIAREQRRAVAEGRAFDPKAVTQFAREVLARDFLGPVLAAMLYTEALPPVLATWFGMGGRAAALENAWSAAWDWAAGGEGENPLARPFLELWRDRDGPWLPLLFLNATHEERGRRVITSPVPITEPPFLDAWDLHRLLGRDLWTTTAIHNSARFSFVSPAGLVLEQGNLNEPRGHVLDGGYFENFGAVTLAEAASAILTLLGDPMRFRPIIVQISSDPSLPDPEPLREPACRAEGLPLSEERIAPSPWVALNELLAPLRGVLATREARGAHAVAELARRAACALQPQPEAPRPVFVHLALCGLDSREPALGWTLDRRSRAAIDRLFDDDGCNARELAILARALAR